MSTKENNMKPEIILDELIISAAEEFRYEWGEYFYQVGDMENYQDIQTESYQRLILDALVKAKNDLEEEIKEIIRQR